MSAPPRNELEALGLSASCADVVRHLWDYLDDQLTPDGADRLRVHMASCTTCRGYSDYQACFLEAVARVRTKSDAPVSLRERLAEGLKSEGCSCWEAVRKDRSEG
ncbi:MAG TPA: zf-HC2 domain-containing protein [Gemmatimonadaceae bacterium]|nr:zf-HC2 domain-containing protein [Gemmatimonadaceae bacterium]